MMSAVATADCRAVVVYGLYTSMCDDIRYVGQTVAALKTRLRAHLSWARRGKKSALFSWIRKHEKAGETILIRPIVRDAIQHETEMQVIAFYRSSGANLVNSTVGGEGIVGLPRSAEHNRKISEGQLGKKRGPLSADMKQRLSEILKTRVFSEEHRRRISEKRKAQGISAETQEKMRQGRINSTLWRAHCGRKPRIPLIGKE